MTERSVSRYIWRTALGAGVLTTALAASSFRLPRPVETASSGPAPVVIIDIAPEQPVAGITQSEFPNNNELMMKVLWQNLKKWALQPNNTKPPHGPTVVPTKSNNSLSHVKDAIENGVLGNYKNHGVLVAQTLMQVAHAHGGDGAVDMLALQNLVDPADIESVVDRDGNEGIAFAIRSKPIIEALQKLPQAPRVVNMSFMMGRNKLFRLQGNNRFKIESAYSGAHAAENIREFFAVASAFPDTLFVSAAGNNGEDLDTLRQQVGESWSPNTLFVADWANGAPASGVVGADVFVPSQKFGINSSSSMAAPAISEIADWYSDLGHPALEARELVLGHTRPVEYISPRGILSAPVLFDLPH